MKTFICTYRWVFFCFMLQMITNTYVFGQKDTIKIDDDTYGKGGFKLKITDKSMKNAQTNIVEIYDAKKRLRESSSTMNFDTGQKHETVSIMDSNKKMTYFKEINHDQFGNESEFVEIRYKDGKQTYGFERNTGQDGKKHIKKWNDKTHAMEEEKGGASATVPPIEKHTKPDTTREPDNTYGPGGVKETVTFTDPTGEKRINAEITDAQKRKRGHHRTTLKVDNSRVEEEWVYDPNESSFIIYSTDAYYDQFGTQTEFREDRGKEGTATYGYRWYLDANGKKHVETLNLKTKKFEESKSDSTSNGNPPVNNSVGSAPFMANQLYAGFSVIREDSKPGFFTYGGEIKFNHLLDPQFGLSADVGLNFGSSMGVDYTKKTALLGAFGELLSKKFKEYEQGQGAKADVDVHLLGGISSISSSFNFIGGTYKYTSNVFTIDLGLGAGYPLNADGTMMFAGSIDYLPTISGGVKSNVRASVGLKFGFGSKKQGSHSKMPKISPVKRQEIG
ncbi:MAG: hypothetical protein ACXVJN_02000 [Mucilaginibacter sp.]